MYFLVLAAIVALILIMWFSIKSGPVVDEEERSEKKVYEKTDEKDDL